MKTDKREVIAIWGIGNYFENVIDKINPQLNIVAMIDMNPQKQGLVIKYAKRELRCYDCSIIKELGVNKILVATRNVADVEEVKRIIDNDRIEIVHISEEIRTYKATWEKRQIEEYDRTFSDTNAKCDSRIKCFINISVPIDFCNLKCSYCYVNQNSDFYKKEVTFYSPEFMRRAFSKNRIGGVALINLCGMGETCLCKDLVEVVSELLKEGHFVSIITNALIREALERLLSLDNSNHLFFKCSFHYQELKRKGLLKLYAENVQMIIRSEASLSVELVPHDEIISEIDEIKEYSLKNFGALPHVTVARDESLPNYPILTQKGIDEYVDVWSKFDSPLFNVKMRHLQKQCQYCISGKGTILVDLEHGGTVCCPYNKQISNIYSDISKPIAFDEIGDKCSSPYCINSHAYITLGMIPQIEEIHYLDVRDRQCSDGSFWIKNPLRGVFTQRICDNLGE